MPAIIPYTIPIKHSPAPTSGKDPTGTAPVSPTVNANYSGRPGQKLQSVKYIVIHYIGNGPQQTGEEGKGVASWWYHADNAGRSSAHFIVQEDGKILNTVPENEVAYHASNLTVNKNSIGIEMCTLPGTTEVGQGAEQATIGLVKQLMQKHNVDPKNIVRHFDCNGKDCPRGFTGQKNERWLKFKNACGGKFTLEDIDVNSIVGERGNQSSGTNYNSQQSVGDDSNWTEPQKPKNAEELAQQFIDGLWGNEPDRSRRVNAAGLSNIGNEAQQIVNKKMNENKLNRFIDYSDNFKTLRERKEYENEFLQVKLSEVLIGIGPWINNTEWPILREMIVLFEKRERNLNRENLRETVKYFESFNETKQYHLRESLDDPRYDVRRIQLDNLRESHLREIDAGRAMNMISSFLPGGQTPMGAAFGNSFGGQNNLTGQLMNGAMDSYNQSRDAGGSFGQNLGAAAKGAFGAGKNFVGNIANNVKGIGQAFKDGGFKGGMNAIGSGIADFATKNGGALGGLIGAGIRGAQNGGGLGGALSAVGKSIGDAIKGVADKVSSAFSQEKASEKSEAAKSGDPNAKSGTDSNKSGSDSKSGSENKSGSGSSGNGSSSSGSGGSSSSGSSSGSGGSSGSSSSSGGSSSGSSGGSSGGGSSGGSSGGGSSDGGSK